MKNTLNKSLLIGAAVSGLMLIGNCSSKQAVTKPADQSLGKCYGVNDCKGKTACGAKDGSHDCSGKNSCKGKGWLKMSQDDCQKKGGEFAS